MHLLEWNVLRIRARDFMIVFSDFDARKDLSLPGFSCPRKNEGAVSASNRTRDRISGGSAKSHAKPSASAARVNYFHAIQTRARTPHAGALRIIYSAPRAFREFPGTTAAPLRIRQEEDRAPAPPHMDEHISTEIDEALKPASHLSCVGARSRALTPLAGQALSCDYLASPASRRAVGTASSARLTAAARASDERRLGPRRALRSSASPDM